LAISAVALCGAMGAAQNVVSREQYEKWVDYVNCKYVCAFIDKKIDQKNGEISEMYEKDFTGGNKLKLNASSPDKALKYDEIKKAIGRFAKAEMLAESINGKKRTFKQEWTKKQLIESLLDLPADSPTKYGNGFKGYLSNASNVLRKDLQKQIPDNLFVAEKDRAPKENRDGTDKPRVLREQYEKWVDYVNCKYVCAFIDRKIGQKNGEVSEMYEKDFTGGNKLKLDASSPDKALKYDEIKKAIGRFAKAEMLAESINGKKRTFKQEWTKEQLIESLLDLPADSPTKYGNGFKGYLSNASNVLRKDLQKQIPDNLFAAEKYRAPKKNRDGMDKPRVLREQYEKWVDYVNCKYVCAFIDKNIEQQNGETNKMYEKDFIDVNKLKLNVSSPDKALKYYEIKKAIGKFEKAEMLAESINDKKLAFKREWTREWTKEQLIDSLLDLPADKPLIYYNGFKGYLSNTSSVLRMDLQEQIPDDLFVVEKFPAPEDTEEKTDSTDSTDMIIKWRESGNAGTSNLLPQDAVESPELPAPLDEKSGASIVEWIVWTCVALIAIILLYCLVKALVNLIKIRDSLRSRNGT
jgi:hypothetical protein